MESGRNGDGNRGIWSPSERVKTIDWRDLKALRLVLELISDQVLEQCRRKKAVVAGATGISSRPILIKAWVDNSAVGLIVRSMVTIST